jgi:hypothetical protein
MSRSPLAQRVDGIITDAPASSFRDVVDAAADFRTLPVGDLPIPESLEDAALLLTSVRFDVDFASVNYIDMADLIEVPLLTLQGSEDETVPQTVNDRFMNEGSGQKEGTYVVGKGADHVLSWNVDPKAYEAAITKFVKGLK